MPCRGREPATSDHFQPHKKIAASSCRSVVIDCLLIADSEFFYPGVNVMITTFDDFDRFSAISTNFRRKKGDSKKKKTNDHFFVPKRRVLSRNFFGENLLKIVTSTPPPKPNFSAVP
jgi:hypothetical protein